jgi:hypothetical protein
MLSLWGAIPKSIITTILFAIKKPSTEMDQLWVVHPAVMGYRADHEKKMAYIAA